MSTVQKALAIVGIAKQSAKASAATDPTFIHGLISGKPFKIDVKQAPEMETLDASRLAYDGNRDSAVPGLAFDMRLKPATSGLWVYGALGAIASAGSAPTTHTITPAAALPYLTAWGKLGGQLHKVQDCKVDELDISWTKAGAAVAKATLLGTIPTWASSITPGTDDSTSNYFRAAGGTFKMDAASGTAVTAAISAGGVKISNNLSPVLLSASVVPDDIVEGHQSIAVTLILTIANLNEWRKAITNASGGTTVSEVVVKGSFDVKFIIDANTSLQLAATNVMFMGDFPDADPAGGPAELTLVGDVLSNFTATIKNAVASY